MRLPIIMILVSIAMFYAVSKRAEATITSAQIRTQDINDICHTKTGAIRNVPESVKRDVYIRDGHPEGNHKGISGPYAFEVDHIVSLTLGGTNDQSNLKIQSYDGPCSAHDKDRLENKLHSLICKGKIKVHDAQELIYDDWERGYKMYVNAAGCGK